MDSQIAGGCDWSQLDAKEPDANTVLRPVSDSKDTVLVQDDTTNGHADIDAGPAQLPIRSVASDNEVAGPQDTPESTVQQEDNTRKEFDFPLHEHHIPKHDLKEMKWLWTQVCPRLPKEAYEEDNNDPNPTDLPEHEVFSDSFESIQPQLAELAQELLTIFQSSHYEDEHIARVIEAVQAYLSGTATEPIRIGIRGEQGVGKSFFINNLLGLPGLARSGNTGRAVTHAPTEYTAGKPSQDVPFVIRVQVMSKQDIIESLISWIATIRAQYESDAIEDRPDENDVGSALSNFHSLVGHAEAFHKAKQVEDWFSDNISCITDDGEIANLALPYVDALLRKLNFEDSTINFEAQSTADLNKQLARYTEQPKGGDMKPGSIENASPWPLISKITVMIRPDLAPLLYRGIAIADLPGLSDVNSARTRATETYIRNADYPIVVATASRFLTMDRVVQQVKDMVTYQKEGSMGGMLVLTCIECSDTGEIDNYNPETDLNTKFENLCNAGETLSKITKELRGRLPSRKKGKNKKSLTQEQEEISENLQTLDDWVRVVSCLRRECLVKARKDHCLEEMTKDWTPRVGFAKIPLLRAVANADFDRHLQNKLDGEIPISLDLTGIGQIRRDLSQLCKDKRLEDMGRRLGPDFESLVDHAKIFSTVAKIKSEYDIREVLCGLSSDVTAAISESIESLKIVMRTKMLEQVTVILDEWSTTALRDMSSWLDDSRPWQSFHKVFMKKGVWGSGEEYVNWNAMIVRPVCDFTTKIWNIFTDKVKEKLEAFEADMLKIAAAARDALKRLPFASNETVNDLSNRLSTAERKIKAIRETIQKSVLESARVIKLDLATADHHSALMEVMYPLYQELDAIPRPKTRNRRARLREAIESNEVYNNIAPCAQIRFDAALEQWKQEIKTYAEPIFSDVEQAFDALARLQDIHDPDLDQLREEAKAWVTKATEKHKELKSQWTMVGGDIDGTRPAQKIKIEQV